MRLGFTNGCFDILHPGHIHLLTRAKLHCDHLIVGLNSDRSVRKLKGDDRPYNPERKREAALLALPMVDDVEIFDTLTPLALIMKLKPDVLIKGGDYTENQIAGAEFVRSYGGHIIIVPLLTGHSTTKLIDSMDENP